MDLQEIKIELRQKALSTSTQINPRESSSRNDLSGQAHEKSPSASKVLADAETIYQWLIKDIGLE